MSDRRNGSTPSFEIRRCGPDDAPVVSLLGQATFLEAFAGIMRGPDTVGTMVCDDFVMSLAL